MTTPGTDSAHGAPARGDTDLGLGRVVVQSVRGRFLNRDGSPNSKKYGLGAQRAMRLYVGALNASWPVFFGWLLGGLLLLNGVFALAYTALGADALRGAEQIGLDDPFMRAFSFSIGVFTTTGNSAMYAYGQTANWLVDIESFVGPITLVVAFGIMIARLTRPRMRIGFSDSAIIAPYEGGRAVMFRIVNLQPTEVSDVRARLNLIWFEEINGVRERNIHELTLERDSVELFNLHWTIVHPITASSPLAGITPEKLAAAQAEFAVFINAFEETFSRRVTTRMSYTWDEVRWDVKFASIFANGPDGVIAIDVERLSRTVPLEDGATRTPAPLESAAATS